MLRAAVNPNPRSILSVRAGLRGFIALLAAGTLLVWPSTVLAQTDDSAQNTGPAAAPPPTASLVQLVEAGRVAVRQSQRDYISALVQPKGEVAAAEYLNLLRQELKTNVLAAVRGGSSEVELAVKRAAIEHRLILINAYEAALGMQPGLATTRFNVFTSAELAQVEVELKGLFARLVEASSPFPEGRAPSQLLGRLGEVRHELNGLQVEQALRGPAAGPRVVHPSTDMSLADAEKKFPALAQLGREAPMHAERLLAIEVEYRRGWSPSDPTLLKLQNELAKGPPRAARVAQPTRPDLWPPRPTPPAAGAAPAPAAPEGPLPPPAGSSVEELRATVRAELEAAQRGDGWARAEANAKRALHATFVRQITGTLQNGPELSLAAMTDAELGKLDGDYRNWERTLLEAKTRAGSAAWHGESELAETRRWIEAIGGERRARTPPPTAQGLHGPDKITNALHSGASNAPDIGAFRDVAELTLERERLTAMRIELDRPRPVPDTVLENAYRSQHARVLRAEIAAINRTAGELEAALNKTLRDGRGVQGRLSGSFAADAHRLLRGQAQALQPMIAEATAHSPAAAEILKGVALRPSLLAPPPSSLQYRAERMQEISFQVRAAAGTQALPRAPPVMVDMAKDVPRGGLRAAPVVQVQTGGPPMAEFERLYKPVEANSYAKLVKDIRRAPGGVIVDAPLSDEWRSRLSGVGYDVAAGQMWILIDGSARKIRAEITPALARAAWGFVADGRVAAIDLRPPSSLAVTELIRMIVPWEKLEAMPPLEIPELRREIAKLQSVNLHPALADTSIGGDLIGADELIFQALKLAPIFKASESRYRGIEVTDLRRMLDEDLAALKLGNAVGNYKSILSVVAAEMISTESEVELLFTLRYEIFQLYGDQPPVRLERVSSWFTAHDAELRKASRELQQLLAFSSAVTLLRAAQEVGAPVDTFDLAPLTEEIVTPRFLCRGAVPADCELSRLRGLISE